ncbi:MAG: hypothetical protein M0D54_08150 [Hyphomonadaceae bacterium JAD_PAG50586_4]|nr:MAG: hypothetical protein M0D54_08150 [Hyphomonadaceae bacterium JAD_PAG50586_4]
MPELLKPEQARDVVEPTQQPSPAGRPSWNVRQVEPPGSRNPLTDRVRQIAERTAPDQITKEVRVVRRKERAARQAVFRNGAILFGSGDRLTVAVKDVSASGARIEFFQRSALPEEFVLSEPTLKLRCRVRVVWQREGVAGVMFL